MKQVQVSQMEVHSSARVNEKSDKKGDVEVGEYAVVDDMTLPEEKEACRCTVGHPRKHKIKTCFIVLSAAAIIIGCVLGLAFTRSMDITNSDDVAGRKAAIAGTTFHQLSVIPAKGGSSSRRYDNINSCRPFQLGVRLLRIHLTFPSPCVQALSPWYSRHFSC